MVNSQQPLDDDPAFAEITMKAVVTRLGSISKRLPGSAPLKREIHDLERIREALAEFCL